MDCRRNHRHRNYFILIAIGASLYLWLGAASYPKQIASSLRLLSMLAFCLFFNAGSLGFGLWLAALQPQKIQRARKAYQLSPRLSFIAGLISFLLGFILIAILGRIADLANHALGRLAGVITLPCLAIMFFVAGYLLYAALLGKTLFYQMAAMRMAYQDTIEEQEPDLTQTLKGGLMIEVAALLPFAGQLVNVFLMLCGIGATQLAWLADKQQSGAPQSTRPTSEFSPEDEAEL